MRYTKKADFGPPFLLSGDPSRTCLSCGAATMAARRADRPGRAAVPLCAMGRAAGRYPPDREGILCDTARCGRARRRRPGEDGGGNGDAALQQSRGVWLQIRHKTLLNCS